MEGTTSGVFVAMFIVLWSGRPGGRGGRRETTLPQTVRRDQRLPALSDSTPPAGRSRGRFATTSRPDHCQDAGPDDQLQTGTFLGRKPERRAFAARCSMITGNMPAIRIG